MDCEPLRLREFCAECGSEAWIDVEDIMPVFILCRDCYLDYMESRLEELGVRDESEP